MSTSEPWQNLRAKFLAALDRSPPAPWRDIWRLLLEDEWFQVELRKHARMVLRLCGASDQWLDDVRHEVMLLLSARLSKAVDLGLDREGLERKFPHSLGKFLHNECRHAVRRMVRLHGMGGEPLQEVERLADVDAYRLQVQALELSAAIDDLPGTLRSVMQLYLLGYTIQEMAPLLRLNYKQTYRAFQRAIELIRSELT